jgi:hypothetical protein
VGVHCLVVLNRLVGCCQQNYFFSFKFVRPGRSFTTGMGPPFCFTLFGLFCCCFFYFFVQIDEAFVLFLLDD